MSEWHNFLREMAGKGHSKSELSRMYRERQGRSLIKSSVAIPNQTPNISRDVYYYNLFLYLTIPEIVAFGQTCRGNLFLLKEGSFWRRYMLLKGKECRLGIILVDSVYLLEIHQRLGLELYSYGIGMLLDQTFTYRAYNLLKWTIGRVSSLTLFQALESDLYCNYLKDNDYSRLLEILGPIVKGLRPLEMERVLKINFPGTARVCSFLLDLGLRIGCRQMEKFFYCNSFLPKNRSFDKDPNENLILRLLEQCSRDPHLAEYEEFIDIESIKRAIRLKYNLLPVVEYLNLFPKVMMSLSYRQVRDLFQCLPKSSRGRLGRVFFKLLHLAENGRANERVKYRNWFYDHQKVFKDIWPEEIRNRIRRIISSCLYY